MNYQQTKTIQKYSINKNLLLLGLLVFASFAQACRGGKNGGSTGPGSNNVSNPALLASLGEFGMTASELKTKVGQDAKEWICEDTVVANNVEHKTLKLPKTMKMFDKETGKDKDVPYFKALSGKLVKGKGMLKGEELVENTAITGLFKEVLKKFSEDNYNKNAKIFTLYQLLVLKEGGDVDKFKQEIAKVKNDACGVLVKIGLDGNVEFVDLTKEDVEKLKGKITEGYSKKGPVANRIFRAISQNFLAL